MIFLGLAGEARFGAQLGFILAVTVVLGVIARASRSVDTLGSVVGSALTFLIYVTAGLRPFLGVVAVFGLAWITTRFGYSRKQRLGTAERGRTASQVIANLIVAAACALLAAFTPWRQMFLMALTAALAEAAADTVSSEFGHARSDAAYLITTWERVRAGVDGAISLPGTLAGVAAAVIVSIVCVPGGLIFRHWIAIPAGAAVLGMFADSYLGAWFERREKMDNDTVNFLSTSVAALLAMVAEKVVDGG
jgi:uncharacterized protein (TIGR00297 family)